MNLLLSLILLCTILTIKIIINIKRRKKWKEELIKEFEEDKLSYKLSQSDMNILQQFANKGDRISYAYKLHSILKQLEKNQ